ncbi:MAG: L-methionine sulfoximine/L-methionine sulfone acetyltransferase [Acinetobacter bereziniae]|uniref:L-methionine sulfoximine/L-methionine sulfone acetyltransferase n=1 Tax=Acinetobacter bereziniae TaxID=106648 RepID=A0A833PJS9_ACIBZ|nr:MAG: L-methionine sulfoximine/L-methionine sulfone acetyltransferase [Acinetobacter bereziniae]
MNFQIRPAKTSDLTEIMHIYNQEIQTGLATWNSQLKTLDDYQQWFLELEQQQFPLFVAEETSSHAIAGYADYASFRAINGYKQTVEHSVYINPSFARKGLGKRLMLKLIEHAQQHHIQVMVAAIDHENAASIYLHQQLGFKQTGYMPQVGQKFGIWRDLVLMQLNFDESPLSL